MPEPTAQSTSAFAAPDVIPAIRYRDAPAAIDWLECAFGFERHMLLEGEGGRVEHAELRVGSGMVMVGSVRDDAFNARVPSELGGTTAGFYVIVTDPDAHFERARDAGAEIVMELTDQDYGSRDYTARDPEGHLWHFGTYRRPHPEPDHGPPRARRGHLDRGAVINVASHIADLPDR